MHEKGAMNDELKKCFKAHFKGYAMFGYDHQDTY